jgi:hypothetical protein
VRNPNPVACASAGTASPPTVYAAGFGFLTGASLAGLALSPVLGGLMSKGHLLGIFAVDLALLAGVSLVVFRRMPPNTRHERVAPGA